MQSSIIRRHRSRAGFALTDLIILLVIGFLLSAVVLPQIPRSRITARRTECLNNIRNVGIACQSYATAQRGELPMLKGKGTINWGTTASPRLQPVPWTVQLFPYLELGPLEERILRSSNDDPDKDLSTNRLAGARVRVFTCPDDSRDLEPGTSSFAANGGYVTSQFWGKDDTDHLTTAYDFAFNGYSDQPNADDQELARGTGVVWRDEPVTINEISRLDGSTETILVTENMQAGPWAGAAPSDSVSDGLSRMVILWPVQGAASGGVTGSRRIADSTACGGLGTLESPSAALAFGLGYQNCWQSIPNLSLGQLNSTVREGTAASPHPSSHHKGGVNVIFVGGNGKFLPDSIDVAILAALYTWNGTAQGGPKIAPTSF